MNDAKRLLIICAHSDDQVIGAGGTMAKLARQGTEVRTIICSFGEQSHPHMQEVEVRKMRVAESRLANTVLGGKATLFLGLPEGKFIETYHAKGWRAKLVRQIQQFDPQVVLTHAPDDLHPDHRAVYTIATDVHRRAKSPSEMYVFDVWTVWNTRKRTRPKLIVDITGTFSRKLDALSAFKSQKVALFTLLWTVYVKAIYYGWKRETRYAEVFYKVR